MNDVEAGQTSAALNLTVKGPGIDTTKGGPTRSQWVQGIETLEGDCSGKTATVQVGTTQDPVKTADFEVNDTPCQGELAMVHFTGGSWFVDEISVIGGIAGEPLAGPG